MQYINFLGKKAIALFHLKIWASFSPFLRFLCHGFFDTLGLNRDHAHSSRLSQMACDPRWKSALGQSPKAPTITSPRQDVPLCMPSKMAWFPSCKPVSGQSSHIPTADSPHQNVYDANSKPSQMACVSRLWACFGSNLWVKNKKGKNHKIEWKRWNFIYFILNISKILDYAVMNIIM